MGAVTLASTSRRSQLLDDGRYFVELGPGRRQKIKQITCRLRRSIRSCLVDDLKAFAEAGDDADELIAARLKVRKRCVKARVEPRALQRADRNDPVFGRIGHADVRLAARAS